MHIILVPAFRFNFIIIPYASITLRAREKKKKAENKTAQSIYTVHEDKKGRSLLRLKTFVNRLLPLQDCSHNHSHPPFRFNAANPWLILFNKQRYTRPRILVAPVEPCRILSLLIYRSISFFRECGHMVLAGHPIFLLYQSYPEKG